MKVLAKYGHEFLGILFAFLLLNVWYLTGLAVEEEVLPKSYEMIARLIISVFGAFVGAYFAFKLNNRREEEKQNEKRLNAIRITLITIWHQIRSLAPIKNTLLREENNPYRAVFVEPSKLGDYSDLNVNITSLDFLSSINPTLVLNLKIASNDFFKVIRIAEKREKYFEDHIGPIVNEHYEILEKPIGEIDDVMLRGKFNEREWKYIEKLTGELYTATYSNFRHLNEIKNELLEISC